MRAWQFHETHKPLVLTEVADPSPGDGEVLIDIKAAGLCHSDVGLLEDEGWLSMLAKLPITIGHENAGVIAEVGSGVTDFKVGDRVSVWPMSEHGAPGYSFDGGFAEKMVVNQAALIRIPDEVDWINGAAATDAGMTSHGAVMTRGGVKSGDNVCIIGLGGLGQIGARIAVLAGANVYGAEINEKVWSTAKELGLKDVKKSVKDFDDVVFDVIVDFAGFGVTTADAIDVIRRDGVVVVVGMGKLEALISTKSLILNQAIVRGSNGGSKEDISSVYEYMATGKLKPQITTIGFDEVSDGLGRLQRGEVQGRLVMTL